MHKHILVSAPVGAFERSNNVAMYKTTDMRWLVLRTLMRQVSGIRLSTVLARVRFRSFETLRRVGSDVWETLEVIVIDMQAAMNGGGGFRRWQSRDMRGGTSTVDA